MTMRCFYSLKSAQGSSAVWSANAASSQEIIPLGFKLVNSTRKETPPARRETSWSFSPGYRSCERMGRKTDHLNWVGGRSFLRIDRPNGTPIIGPSAAEPFLTAAFLPTFLTAFFTGTPIASFSLPRSRVRIRFWATNYPP